MNMQDLSPNLDPNRLAKRMVQCAYNRDGLPELVLGASCLLVSAASWISFASHGFIGKAAGVALSFLWVILIILCLFSSRIMEGIRNSYLVDRIG